MNVLYVHATLKTHRVTSNEEKEINEIVSNFSKCLDANDKTKFTGIFSQLISLIEALNNANYTVKILAHKERVELIIKGKGC